MLPTTRGYGFHKRPKKRNAPICSLPSEEAVKALADELYLTALRDGSAAYEVVNEMKDLDMLDILFEEMQYFPDSPVSIELRRRLKEKAVAEAKTLSMQIFVSAVQA